MELSAATGIINLLLEKGIDSFTKSNAARNLRGLVREQIRRELQFNRELLDELARTTSDGSELPLWTDEGRKTLVAAIRISSFRSLDRHLLPLTLFFDERLEEERHLEIFEVEPNGTYPPEYGRVKPIHEQCELIERTYRRLAFYRVYGESSPRVPNLPYVRLLVLGSVNSLRGGTTKSN